MTVVYSPAPKPEPTPKKARRPLPRSKTPIKRSRVKRVNVSRRSREFARAYHSKERVQFVKASRCCVGDCRGGPIDNAHIIGGGMGRKADAKFIVALCRAHHRDLHRLGVELFEATHRLSLGVIAADFESAWQRYRASRGASA